MEQKVEVQVPVGSPPVDIPVKLPVSVGSLPSDTTHEEDRVTRGQRRINLIWESTQGVIAIIVTTAVIWKNGQYEVLNYAFFLVVSMYFIRTNGHKQGGVGYKLPGTTRV